MAVLWRAEFSLFNQTFTLQISNHSLSLLPTGVQTRGQNVDGGNGLHDVAMVWGVYG